MTGAAYCMDGCEATEAVRYDAARRIINQVLGHCIHYPMERQADTGISKQVGLERLFSQPYDEGLED